MIKQIVPTTIILYYISSKINHMISGTRMEDASVAETKASGRQETHQ